MADRGKKMGIGKYKTFNMSRTKAFSVKQEAFFIIFKCFLLVKYKKIGDTGLT